MRGERRAADGVALSLATPLTLLVGRDDGVVQSYYGVRHEGKLWLVTAWLVDPRTQEAVPERMIRVDSYQMAEGPWDYDNVRLPRAVIEGVDQGPPGFEVRSLPTSPRVHRRDLRPLPTVFP